MTETNGLTAGFDNLTKNSGYLLWIYESKENHNEFNQTQKVDYELHAIFATLTIKLFDPWVKNVCIVVPNDYEFKYDHLFPNYQKILWNKILKWNFKMENFWFYDLKFLQHSPFRYTARIDSDVIITGPQICFTLWRTVWQKGYAVSQNICNHMGNIVSNFYRKANNRIWQNWMNLQLPPVPNAYVAVMAFDTDHNSFYKTLYGWEWALRFSSKIQRQLGRFLDSDELLSLSFLHSGLPLDNCAYFVHAKPKILFDVDYWPPNCQLHLVNNTWTLCGVKQHMPIHFAEKFIANETFTKILWQRCLDSGILKNDDK